MRPKGKFSRDPKTAKIGEEILPLHVGYLTEFFQKKAEEEINYTSTVREKSLMEIKEMISKDLVFNTVRLNDELLLMFLNSRKYDVSKALLQLKKYVDFRRKNSDIFTNYTYDALSPFFTLKLFTVLPYRCQDGCIVVIEEMAKWNAEKHPLLALKQFFSLLILQFLREPMTQVNGLKVIFDLDANLDIFKICTPQNMYSVFILTLVTLPSRFTGIHLLNVGAIGTILWNIMKIFLSEKIRNRVYIHKTYDTLLDFFPKSILPTKYGGDHEDYDNTDLLRELTSPEKLDFIYDF